MHRHAFWTILLPACAMLIGASAAWAQLGTPSADDLARLAHRGPPPIPRDASARPADADPHDLAGTWRLARDKGPPPADTSAAAGQSGARGVLNTRVVCVPPDGTKVGLDGPLLLTQTPDQITWVAEEMHSIRRIYLTGGFTPGLAPSYLGRSLGHWDRNTLVVETRSLNTLPVGGKRLERWTKSADGTTLQINLHFQTADGVPVGSDRTVNLNWSPGEHVLEWICEDYNEQWLPGGKSYQDQINQ